jgi:Bacterial PH domain
MSPTLTVLQPDGTEDGPFTEEEMLDLLQTSEIQRDQLCRVRGRMGVHRVGDLFQVIPPEREVAEPDRGAAEVWEDLAVTPEAFPQPPEATEAARAFFPDLAGSAVFGDPRPSAAASRQTRPTPAAPSVEALLPRRDPRDDQGDFEGDEIPTEPGLAPPNEADTQDETAEPMEESEWSGRPSWLCWSRSWAVVAVCLVVGWWGGRWHAAWPIGGAVGAAVIGLSVVIRRSLVSYRASPEHVEITRGLWNREIRELPFSEIKAVHIRRDGALGLLGIGDIYFSSESGGTEDVLFRATPHVRHLHRLVRRWRSPDDVR